ncbi:uncharacterized protein [Bactrocera oleae]|uniref:uncharacterized protein n=1 Tax=Bactrocera oleae TaxID=104688 RepID=UPI00174AE607|nr:uncharacterized protein LOC106624348 [Bactrocera oleae]XP_036219746.1 uncharacterized protein LOC106624348 [Bactrocera oleae]
MMWGASYLVLLSTFCVISLAHSSQLDDIFTGYLKNVNLYNPEKHSQIVKRRIYEDNQDGSLKKISLQSLIGNLEQNFLQSASSVGNLAQQTTESTESHLSPIENHAILKRKTDNESLGQAIIFDEDHNKTMVEPESVDSINASNENISNKQSGSTRIQVDHISVQPHHGNFPIVPAFQLHQTKLISATFKDTDSKPTQIIIRKTNIQATPLEEKSETINDQMEKNNNTKQTVNEETENLLPSTTKNTVSDLKQTEAELKANVAEIEAEPVILSARV